MDTIIIIFLLAVIALLLSYIAYGKYRKEKKVKDSSAYIEGLKALLDGNEEFAFSQFRDVVSEDAENIDAYLKIGDILRKYGKPDKALEVHKDLTLRHNLTLDQKKIILKSLVLDFQQTDDITSAISALKELSSLDSKDRWVAEKLLEMHCKTGDWEAAYEVKEDLIKMGAAKTRTGLAIYKFMQGLKLFDEKEFHKARVIFKEAINIDNACTPAYLYIGDSYLAENRTDDAIAIWRKMIERVPSEAHLVLGRLKRALFEIGKFGEISDICNQILAVSPKNLEARLTLADYHSKKGEGNLAVEQLNTAIDDHPKSSLPTLQLAGIYLVSNQTQKLADLLHKLMERFEAAENEYHCSRCGYEYKTKIWLCPSCRAVDSFVM